MFTGIIETIGIVKNKIIENTNVHFEIESTISNFLQINQSVAHNGVCLTVTKCNATTHWTTAVNETLMKSSLDLLVEGELVNLERCMKNNGRFDGHIVQGHVDQVGVCTNVKEVDGSWIVSVQYDSNMGNVTVEKGSICLNGISLTCYNAKKNSFMASIIPYTFYNTNLKNLKKGTHVNLEFDIIGKYVQRLVGS